MPVQFCPFCGASLSGIDAAFCPRCGRQLPSVSPDATTPATPQPGSPIPAPSPQQQPAWPPQPMPGMYAPPHAQPYPGYQAAPPAYAAPASGDYSPLGAGMAPQYALSTAAEPISAGRAIGVTAAVAAIAFMLVVLSTFPLASRIIGLPYAFYVAQHSFSAFGITSAWALGAAFWIAIARLPRFSWWQVAGECAAICMVTILLLPVIDGLIALLLFGDRAFVRPFVWLAQITTIRLILIMLFAAASALTAAGLAAGFVDWRRVRTARIPVSPATSLLVPVGVAAGVFVCTDVLIIVTERYVSLGLGSDLLWSFLFDVLPVTALPIAAGMITFASLRDKLRTASAPAPAPYPPAPPSGPVPR